jgi:hypothetical protein
VGDYVSQAVPTVAGYLGGGVGQQTLIERWNGTSWNVFSSPNQGPYSYLNAVTCVSASDCWAVGYYIVGAGGAYDTLIEHWDGTSWTIIPSPSPVAVPYDILLNVACASTSDCWAVGYYNPNENLEVPITEHWDGNAWTLNLPPSTSPPYLTQLGGVTCVSKADCWAVGWYATSNSNYTLTLVEHWDGTSWAVVDSPNDAVRPYNDLFSVACDSASDCWAVGLSSFVGLDPRPSPALAEHWDGKSWTIATSPSTTGYNVLDGVTCLSTSNCWAVGSGPIVDDTLAWHWDGISWRIVRSQNVGSSVNQLFGVACLSGSDCLAAGISWSSPGLQSTLAEQYLGTCCPTASGTPSPAPAPPLGPGFSTPTRFASPTPLTPVAGFTAQDAEPSIRVANDGSIYVAAPLGTPAGGCDFWTVQPGGASSSYKGRSDNNIGGGDCDLATSAQLSPLPAGGGKDVVFASSLQGTTGITTTSSSDGGNTFVSNPAGQPIPAVDRMWNAAGAANNPLDFYMTFREPNSGDIVVEHSLDGGLTFTPVSGTPVTTTNSVEGNLAVSSDGQSLYLIYADANAGGQVHLAASHDAGATWHLSVIHDGSDTNQTYDSIFPSIALDPDNSHLYAVYSDGSHIHFASARSDAGPWTEQIVPTLDNTQSNVFPWVVSGKHGQADVVWYGTPDNPETAGSRWNVYFARYTNSIEPVVSRVSTVPNHVGYICMDGLLCSGTTGTTGDRSMLDFFQVADDSNGRAHIAWAMDNPGNANEPTVIMYAEELPQPSSSVAETPWAALLLVPGILSAALVGVGRRRRSGRATIL